MVAMCLWKSTVYVVCVCTQIGLCDYASMLHTYLVCVHCPPPLPSVPPPSPPLRSTSLPTSALHVAIINNHTDAVRALLDVLPQLPPTQTPVVDTQNHLHQVCTQELVGGASE